MKVTLFVTACIALTLAEPPVPTIQYLPSNIPLTSLYNSASAPSLKYGVPSTGVVANIITTPNVRYVVPNFEYAVPSTNRLETPKSQYGPPTQYSVSNIHYALSSNNQIETPKPQYGVPTQNTHHAVSNLQYVIPTNNRIETPKPQYGVPSVATPTSQNGVPNHYYAVQPNNRIETAKTQYGVPSISTSNIFGTLPESNSHYSVPQISESYLIPSAGTTSQYETSALNSDYSAPVAGSTYELKSEYGVPAVGNDHETNSQPANYDYKYEVLDHDKGNDFSHEESRRGDAANGRYHVLLPDGKRQTVEYTADAGGYKSKITYEQVSNGLADHAAQSYGQTDSIQVNDGQEGYYY